MLLQLFRQPPSQVQSQLLRPGTVDFADILAAMQTLQGAASDQAHSLASNQASAPSTTAAAPNPPPAECFLPSRPGTPPPAAAAAPEAVAVDTSHIEPEEENAGNGGQDIACLKP